MFSVKICKILMFSVLEQKGVRTVISLIKDQ